MSYFTFIYTLGKFGDYCSIIIIIMLYISTAPFNKPMEALQMYLSRVQVCLQHTLTIIKRHCPLEKVQLRHLKRLDANYTIKLNVSCDKTKTKGL